MHINGERMTESIDLLLELLDTHKPHLKPYSGRLRSWLELLDEYNDVAGTHYKQSRTLKKRFERVVDAYRDDKSRIVCRNSQLLGKLVGEYSKPYKSLGKCNSDQEDEGQMEQYEEGPGMQSGRHEIGESPEESESGSTDSSEEIRSSNGGDASSRAMPRVVASIASNGKEVSKGGPRFASGRDRGGGNSAIATETGPASGPASGPTPTISAFDMEELLRTDDQSKESSSQPPPLDTITLGMPRSFSVSNDGEADNTDNPSILATSHYPPTASATSQIFSDLPKTFFIIDRNNRLVEVTSSLSSTRDMSTRVQPPTKTQASTASSPRTELGRSPHDPASYDKLHRQGNEAPPTARELRLLAELKDIRREQRLYQSTVMSKMDAILQMLGNQENECPLSHSHTAIATDQSTFAAKRRPFRIKKVGSNPH